MVARLCRLRLTQLLAVFRGSPLRVLRTVVVGAIAVIVAVVFAWAPTALATDLDDRGAIDTVFVATVLGAALIVPFFANQRHLEPRQFAAYPVSPGSLATGLLISTLISWPVIWLVVWLAAVVALRPEWHPHAGMVVIAGLLTVVLAVTAARCASALSKLLIAPQAAGLLRAIGALLLVAVLPVLVFALAQTLRAPGGAETTEAAVILGWLPAGAPGAGLALAIDGQTGAAMMRWVLAAAWWLVLVAVWFVVVRVSVQSVARPADPLLARRSMGWFDRFAATPAQVIAARTITYWARDPRYRVSLFAAPIAAALVVVALWIAGVEPLYLALVPLPIMVLLLGWSLHNDIAMDSTAIWMHVASGTRGIDDRWGRLAPVTLIGVPLVLVGSSVTVTVMGDWRALPAVIGLNLAVLLVASGVASVFSALLPYPTTRPGETPFTQPAVSGSGAGTAQTLSMLVSLVVAAPPVWFAVEAALDPHLVNNLLVLLGATAYGVLAVAVGVFIGGRVYDRIGPDYVALTQTFD